MNSVIEDRASVIITRATGEPVIMLAKEDYDATLETLHLLRSPRNAERLRDAIAGVEAGNVERANLLDGADS